MIQPNELRIGNWIYDDGKPIQVTTGLFYLMYEYEDRFDSYHDILPIPLTEEILLKCGFDGIGFYENVFSKGSFRVHLNKEGKKALLVYHHDNNHIELEVKSLHDLQNVFFALTGTELEVKL